MEKEKFTYERAKHHFELFKHKQQQSISIKTEIDATDKAIDKMVYELYGFSEEEIEIVENN